MAVLDKAKAKSLPPGDVDVDVGDGSLARIRAELDAIRASLTQVERELASLESGPAAPAARRARPERYYQVLIEVYERGPHGVSAAELDELAQLHEYDRRGLNGYFAGLRAPLRTHDGRIQLTLEGRRLVHERLAREGAAVTPAGGERRP